MRIALYFQLILSFFILGCGAPKASNPRTTDPIAIIAGPPEETYCNTTHTYTSPMTVKGSATYQAREPSANGLGGPGTPKPIRHAEVMIKNSAGDIAQCTHTDSNGDYEFKLPNDGGTYYLYVNSRGDNNYVKASVLDAPNSNRHYSLAGWFTADGTKSLPTLNASVLVSSGIIGAAFNIFDQIVEANEFLRAQVGACTNGSFTGCTDFTVAPKVQAYWKMGVNPATYLNSTDALSFYLPGYSRLFILGGENGNTTVADTDHFDNSVILHEYGHFLEDEMFQSDSPGGSHNGDAIIDPRLAWSEGFGNFFQAAVLYDPTNSAETPYYIDTIGNVDGTTKYAFKIHLEDSSINAKDVPQAVGEGHYREFSVTRFLWDAIDTGTDTKNGFTDSVSDAFKDIWATLTKSSGGLNQNNLAFRSILDFHLFQDGLAGRIDFEDIRGVERHTASLADITNIEGNYAQYVTTGSTCTYNLTPTSDPNGSFSRSNLFRNNRFFHLKIPSAQTSTITLEYTDADGVAPKSDVDLYIYNRRARFGVVSDMVGRSEQDPSGGIADTEIESATVNFAADEDYLINVKVYTGASGNSYGSAFNFKLKLNGSELCPSSLP